MWDIDALIALTPAVAFAVVAGAVGAHGGDSVTAAYAACAGFVFGLPVSFYAHRSGGPWAKNGIVWMSLVAVVAAAVWGYHSGALQRFPQPSLFPSVSELK